MSSNESRKPQENDEIDLGKLLHILLSAKWTIACITFLFSVIGVAYALLATPIYKADALLQVEQKQSGMSALVGEMGDMFSSESSATTEIEIIKSRMILGETVNKLNLDIVVEPNYFPVVGKGIARLTSNQHSIDIARFEIAISHEDTTFTLEVTDAEGQYNLIDEVGDTILSGKVDELSENGDFKLFVRSLSAHEGDEFTLSLQNKLRAIQDIKSNLGISERGKQSGILELSYTGERRSKIEAVLNDISQNYFLQNIARNSAEAEKSLAFLNEHLPGIKGELSVAEDTLNGFRQKNESIDLGLEAQSILKVMVELEAQMNELTFKETEISQRFTKEHPAYISLLDKRTTLEGERDRLNRQIQKLPKTQREVLRMTRDVEVNQQIYIQLLNKVQELNILKAGTVGNVRILDNAQSALLPIKPKKPLIVVLATMLGAMIAIAGVLIQAAFNRGVKSPDEIEALGLAVYATVPKSEVQNKRDLIFGKSKKRSRTGLEENLLAYSNPEDLSIEALRGLRTSLHFAMMEAKNNIISISGPSPGIGKSFVSANLATIIAQSGQKVLVVDADMRKGYMQRHFGLVYENGLSEYLSGKLALEQVIDKNVIENLDVLTRGIVPPNPAELLMHERFTEFMDWANKNYDFIVIDTPPVLAVTDASIIARQSGTTLMVVKYDQNAAKEIDVANSRFEQSGIKVAGTILNMVEQSGSSYNYGYYNYSYKS
ncbi:polysaccharide biosynthesis tyrosine autokinase [Shewanella olleyana]|uniref:polysaccharide biosynthesis tyrosine autokinase n=1 Tax=Shewanella olleyana TaxID=135626 RepID=UPI00200C4E2E|nr:polysaccharide biosynthesis tyrosine autokinase [Shewanella olleyana]MCL1067031.1 polysaccharide biosynthesis tyrosine autokinase [Shewanella olleyana]